MTFDEWVVNAIGTNYSAIYTSWEVANMQRAWCEAVEQVAFLLEDYGTAICGCEGTVRTNTEFYDQLADDIRKRFLTTN